MVPASKLPQVLIAARGLFCCEVQAPSLRPVALVAPGHVRSLFLDQGLNPRSPASQGGFLTPGPPGKSLDCF